MKPRIERFAFVSPSPRVSVAGTSGEMKIVVGLAVIAGLYFGRAIFVPLALAVLISFILAPPLRQLIRLRINRILAVLLVVLCFFSAIFGLALIVGQQVVQLADKLPQYELSLRAKIESFRGPNGEKARLSARIGSAPETQRQEIQEPNSRDDKADSPAGNAKPQPAEKPLRVEVQEPEPHS